MDVVGDDEIEFAVAVVVDEGAAGAPLFAGACDSGLLGYFFEGAVALVVEEAVLAVAGDVEIVEAIVVVVADAGSLAPAVETKPAWAVTSVKVPSWLLWKRWLVGFSFGFAGSLGRVLPLTRKMSGQPSLS